MQQSLAASYADILNQFNSIADWKTRAKIVQEITEKNESTPLAERKELFEDLLLTMNTVLYRQDRNLVSPKTALRVERHIAMQALNNSQKSETVNPADLSSVLKKAKRYKQDDAFSKNIEHLVRDVFMPLSTLIQTLYKKMATQQEDAPAAIHDKGFKVHESALAEIKGQLASTAYQFGEPDEAGFCRVSVGISDEMTAFCLQRFPTNIRQYYQAPQVLSQELMWAQATR